MPTFSEARGATIFNTFFLTDAQNATYLDVRLDIELRRGGGPVRGCFHVAAAKDQQGERASVKAAKLGRPLVFSRLHVLDAYVRVWVIDASPV